MGFVAKDTVEPLDFDFRPHLDVTGTVPEPSSAQVDAYWHAMGTLAKAEQDRLRADAKAEAERLAEDGDGDDGLDRATIADTLANMDPERLKAQRAEIIKALGALCSGQPSTEQLDKLPHRVLQAFSGWLLGELSPEVLAAASRP